MTSSNVSTKDRINGLEAQFVNYVIDRCEKDKGFAAKLRRADNPATEYQSWQIIGPWIDLENSQQRLSFGTVGAGIARSKVKINGSLRIGKAIHLAYSDRVTAEYSDPAEARLRRLLACQSTREACRVVRPVLMLVNSKVEQSLDYISLLRELRYFGDKAKIRWAQDFYGQRRIVEMEK